MSETNVAVIRGNILNVLSEALVLPANTRLHEGSGVSTAIYQAAGRKKLTEACRKIGSCEEGKAVVTPGFDLKSDYIIHTVVPRWIDGEHGEYERLCSSYLAALSAADILDCSSISFPLLGSGNNGYDLGLSFEIAHRTARQFESRALKTIYLVIYGERAAKLVSGKGINYVVLPENYVPDAKTSPNAVPRRKDIVAQAIAQVGDFLGRKENWDAMLDTASKIVKLVKMLHQ